MLRWIKQTLGIEKSPYKPDFKMLKQMILWVDKELSDSKLNKLQEYEDKLEILSEKQIRKYKYRVK